VVGLADVFECEKDDQVSVEGVVADPVEVIQEKAGAWVLGDLDITRLLVEQCLFELHQSVDALTKHLAMRTCVAVVVLVPKNVAHQFDVLLELSDRYFILVRLPMQE
jgi:hypothetical protein